MNTTLEIRPVRPEEYAAAGALAVRAYREFAPQHSDAWRDYLEHIADVAARAPNATVLVAADTDRLVGTVTLELDSRIDPASIRPLGADEAHIRMLGVDPGARSHGVATQLVAACIDRARARGKRCVTLDTAPEMTAARALYTKLGFVRSGTRTLGSGHELLCFELTLTLP